MREPIYVETWEESGNSERCILDMAYTRSTCPTDEDLEIFRLTMADANNCTLKRLLQTRKIEVF